MIYFAQSKRFAFNINIKPLRPTQNTNIQHLNEHRGTSDKTQIIKKSTLVYVVVYVQSHPCQQNFQESGWTHMFGQIWAFGVHIVPARRQQDVREAKNSLQKIPLSSGAFWHHLTTFIFIRCFCRAFLSRPLLCHKNQRRESPDLHLNINLWIRGRKKRCAEIERLMRRQIPSIQRCSRQESRGELASQTSLLIV